MPDDGSSRTCAVSGAYAYHYAANPVGARESVRATEALPAGSGIYSEWTSIDGRIALSATGAAIAITRRASVSPSSSALVSSSPAVIGNEDADCDGETLFHVTWNSLKRELLIKAGVHPLFYWDDGWTFRFAGTRDDLLQRDGIRTLPAHRRLVIGPQGVKVDVARPTLFSARKRLGPKAGLNVLALVTDAFGGQGGIARYNRDFLNAMGSTEAISQVTILPRYAGEVVEDLPRTLQQVSPVAGRSAYSVEALRLAASRSIDMVFCGHLFQVPLGLLISRLLGVPLWLQLHGVEAWKAPRVAARIAAARADLVTSVSRYTRDRFLEWAPLDPERVRILPNTYRSRYTPGPKPASLLNALGVAGRKIIITVSRLSASERYKGHDEIIAALPGVLERCPEAVYLIVGDGDNRQRLEHVAAGSGVGERVIFAGHVEDHQLLDYYRLADVFAMPSTGEGFGIVYLEAAATGLPVIAGNIDGSVDALADGAIGTLINPRSQTELTDALVQALRGDLRPAATPERFTRENFVRHVHAIVVALAEKQSLA